MSGQAANVVVQSTRTARLPKDKTNHYGVDRWHGLPAGGQAGEITTTRWRLRDAPALRLVASERACRYWQRTAV